MKTYKITFLLISVLFFSFLNTSCSDSSPLIGTVNATLIYNFETETSPYEQYLSIFIKAASDDRRVDKMKVTFPEMDYEWFIDEPEQVKAAKSAVDSALKQGKAVATNKEVLGNLKDSREAKSISEALRKVWAYLDGGSTLVDIDALAKLLDKTESLSQAMREYKKQM